MISRYRSVTPLVCICMKSLNPGCIKWILKKTFCICKIPTIGLHLLLVFSCCASTQYHHHYLDFEKVHLFKTPLVVLSLLLYIVYFHLVKRHVQENVYIHSRIKNTQVVKITIGIFLFQY